MEKKDRKAIEAFIETRKYDIMKERARLMDKNYHKPTTFYIGDIFSKEEDKLYVSPIHRDTGCRIFGMKVIADFRIPENEFYMTYGELNR